MWMIIPFKIFLGEVLEIHTELHDTIYEIKQHIQQETGIAVKFIKLIYNKNGRDIELENRKKLRFYQYTPNTPVYIILPRA